jgi:hypothetical protein
LDCRVCASCHCRHFELNQCFHFVFVLNWGALCPLHPSVGVMPRNLFVPRPWGRGWGERAQKKSSLNRSTLLSSTLPQIPFPQKI